MQYITKNELLNIFWFPATTGCPTAWRKNIKHHPCLATGFAGAPQCTPTATAALWRALC